VRVILGGNEFVDCPALLVYMGKPVLRVEISPLQVILEPPEDLRQVPLRHITTDRSDAIFTPANQAVAIGTLIDDETVHLALDLRPVGMNIVATPRGLRIGSNWFVGNVISHVGAAINLA